MVLNTTGICFKCGGHAVPPRQPSCTPRNIMYPSWKAVRGNCHSLSMPIKFSPNPAFFILHDPRIVVTEHVRTKGLLTTNTEVAHLNDVFRRLHRQRSLRYQQQQPCPKATRTPNAVQEVYTYTAVEKDREDISHHSERRDYGPFRKDRSRQ